ncbi:MAG: response regulator transcription factor [Peptococcaceae bacterium]|jgi:two-component system response regulator RegX3|nr:response regulator transcription factor [Peptococcaceae bacterium]
MLDCLIIDDEVSISETICEYFNLFGLKSEYVTDYESGLNVAAEKQPSLILLDVTLGGQSGFALCKTLRETSDVPILFISARNTDDDILVALGVGGDDYITKPFSMAVLLAKAQAMLKRSAATAKTALDETMRFGDVEIEQGSGRVYRGGGLVKLKPLEQKLLLYLYSNRGRRVTKGELLENVWGDSFVGEGTLSVHIRHLREKLEDDPQNPRYIKTMWGSGYMFESRE